MKNFKGDAFKLDGKVLTLGSALSEALAMSREGGKMKLFILAQKLATEKIVEVDKADFELIKKTVEKSEVYANVILGQALMTLDSIKE